MKTQKPYIHKIIYTKVLSYKIFTCLVPQGLGELARQSVKINVDTQDGSWGQTPLSPWR